MRSTTKIVDYEDPAPTMWVHTCMRTRLYRSTVCGGQCQVLFLIFLTWQTDERNECGRKVVNVTEHNTEDACCDTSDLVEPSSAATANGLLTSEIPKAPQTATCDGNGQSEEEREEERDVGPSLVDLQMDERLAGWSAPAQGAGISPRAARAELSAGAGGVEMQQQIKGLGLAGDLVFGKR